MNWLKTHELSESPQVLPVAFISIYYLTWLSCTPKAQKCPQLKAMRAPFLYIYKILIFEWSLVMECPGSEV